MESPTLALSRRSSIASHTRRRSIVVVEPGEEQAKSSSSASARSSRFVTELTQSERAPVHPGQPTSLRELGYDEIWLQNWLVAYPTWLGLGEVTIRAQELTSVRGGSLDILATSVDGDTHYSIEVQLGEVDASHGFRVFDYWGLPIERALQGRRTSQC